MLTLRACAPFSPQPALARSGLSMRSLAYSGPELCRCSAPSRLSGHVVALTVDLHDPKVAALVAVAAAQIVFNLLIFFNLDKVDEASSGRPDDGTAAADTPTLERSRGRDGSGLRRSGRRAWTRRSSWRGMCWSPTRWRTPAWRR